MKATNQLFCRGRGSNPASRANLKKALRDSYVVIFHEGRWHQFSGPHFGKVAWRKQAELTTRGHLASVSSTKPATHIPASYRSA